MTTAVPTASPVKAVIVIRAAPNRSASAPPPGRASEPSSGPMNVRPAACSGVRPKSFCRTRPKAKLYPMNEPNVPMYSSEMVQQCGSRRALE